MFIATRLTRVQYKKMRKKSASNDIVKAFIKLSHFCYKKDFFARHCPTP